MKILFLIRSLETGGAERQLSVLARGLQGRGHAVTVLYCYDSSGAVFDELSGSGVKIRHLRKRGRWDVIGFLRRLLQAVKEEEPDALHGYLDLANLLCATIKPLLPRVNVIWGVRNSYMDFAQFDWLNRAAYAMTAFLSRVPDRIIFNSRRGLEFHGTNGYSLKRAVVIPNGIDTARFRPDAALGLAFRARLGVPPGAPLIGTVGRLDPMKDYPVFLEAASIFASQPGGENARFICVGDGPAPYKVQLRQHAEKLGIATRVIWLEGCPDLTAAYNALSVFTSSSYGEGFSNTVAEAMACGTPCVVTDVGDSAAIIGSTGIAVPPKEPRRLADGWKRLLAADRGRNGAEACRRVRERFSVETLVDSTLQVLQDRAIMRT